MVMLVNSNSIDTVTTINTVIKIGYLVVAITEIGNNFGYPHRLHLLGTIAVVQSITSFAFDIEDNYLQFL